MPKIGKMYDKIASPRKGGTKTLTGGKKPNIATMYTPKKGQGMHKGGKK